VSCRYKSVENDGSEKDCFDNGTKEQRPNLTIPKELQERPTSSAVFGRLGEHVSLSSVTRGKVNKGSAPIQVKEVNKLAASNVC